MLQLVVELAIFSRDAERLFSREEREEIAFTIARNPKAWPIERGTGGVRKARFGLGGRGKSGGARIMYLHFADAAPIYLLLVFPKGRQATMTPEQKRTVRRMVEAIKAEWKARIHDQVRR
jgi:hypothetical protein